MINIGGYMMGYLQEYVSKRLSAEQLQDELIELIKRYNRFRDSYLFVYAAANEKQIAGAQLNQDDYFFITDLLKNKGRIPKLDFYIETHGGRGESAEEIVRFLHEHSEHLTFVVSGEAKSAGTIMVLSGHEIMMTDTGSLGPIDAQIQIGRSTISAYDYYEWVKEKHKEALEEGTLNPFDAIMIAQINPGELNGVINALNFAQDLVREWLCEYKFSNWKVTETRGIEVTPEMKRTTAKEIAEILCNHGRWRSHGRSIKIQDLHDIGLKITRIDDDKDLADIVYRIQAVCKLIFASSTAIKIYATEDGKMFTHAAPGKPLPIKSNPPDPDIVEIEENCPKCGVIHKILGRLNPQAKMTDKHISEGFIYYPEDDKIKCSCGYEIDLTGIKNHIEGEINKKILKGGN